MNDSSAKPTELQLSARDDEDRWILSVLAKRTYSFTDNEIAALADTQLPLVDEPVYAVNNNAVLLADIDLWPFKKFTDIVVIGNAYNHEQLPSFQTGISVGNCGKEIRVTGNRRCTRTANGKILFSDPTILTSVPLTCQFAYGGCDRYAEKKYGNPVDVMKPVFSESDITPHMLDEATPFAYPRNHYGRGYIFEAASEALETLELPNLEFPDHPLTPDNILVENIGNWPKQPLPAYFEWTDYGSFPRVALFGVVPEHTPLSNPQDLPEVRFGFAEPEILKDGEEPSIEAANGASLGLIVPFLQGDEIVELLNMHPKKPMIRFQLPKEKPQLHVDGRNGRLLRTQPVIHSLVIEPDEERFSIVWRGSELALRPYLEEEIGSMPFSVKW